MPLDPFFAKGLRFALIGLGAVTIVSGVVNIVAAVNLVDASEAESLGLSRINIIGGYVSLIMLGIALVYFGARKKPKK